MDELLNLLNLYFSRDFKYHTKEEIAKDLNIKGEIKHNIFEEALNQLVLDGIILQDKKGYRAFSDTFGYAYGQIEINKSGTGFVHTSNGYTILVENNDLNGALNGDTVLLSNITAKRKDYYAGEVHKILKRKIGNVIFEVVGSGKVASLIPYNYLENINVDVNNSQLNNLIDGDLVLVKVGCNSSKGAFEGRIEKIIGHKDDPDVDIKLILEKYDIPIDFPKEVLDEAKILPKEVQPYDINDRVDLRNENIFTIDCDTTKDRDDAVGIKKLDNGNYLLKVNIAHVSHYIKRGSKLFEEAVKRCFSHYPGTTCVPMFPHIVSNGICSLNPGVDRLTKTVEMEINSKGKIVNYNIYDSVINSKKAMSYSNVNKVLNYEELPDYEPFKEDLMLMAELNKILEDARSRRNYINFNTSEVQVVEDNSKIVVGFKPNDAGLSGQIIENFMLLANATIYNHYSWFILPYRVHEAPDEERVKEVINVLRASGMPIPKMNNIDSRAFKTIIEKLGNSEAATIAREYLLRSQKKARYDINNVGHFALQCDVYGHFTSPIRRIPDLLMLTIMDSIETFNYTSDDVQKFEDFLSQICKRANEIEKTDRLIEEETNDMLMAEYMEKHIGEQFDVYVTDLNSHSMSVRTDNLIRGKIKLEDMNDDKYYYDEDRSAVIGRSTKNKYQIGNKLCVLVKEANKATRTVNFETPKTKTLKKIL